MLERGQHQIDQLQVAAAEQIERGGIGKLFQLIPIDGVKPGELTIGAVVEPRRNRHGLDQIELEQRVDEDARAFESRPQFAHQSHDALQVAAGFARLGEQRLIAGRRHPRVIEVDGQIRARGEERPALQVERPV